MEIDMLDPMTLINGIAIAFCVMWFINIANHD